MGDMYSRKGHKTDFYSVHRMITQLSDDVGKRAKSVAIAPFLVRRPYFSVHTSAIAHARGAVEIIFIFERIFPLHWDYM
jgi:hypothetical protein